MKIYIWLKNFKCQSCNRRSLKWRLALKVDVMRTRRYVLQATLEGKQKIPAMACCNIHVLLATLEGKQKMPTIAWWLVAIFMSCWQPWKENSRCQQWLVAIFCSPTSLMLDWKRLKSHDVDCLKTAMINKKVAAEYMFHL